MLTILRTRIAGWEAAIRGMRNPMNSWDMSDSIFADEEWLLYRDPKEVAKHNFDPRCDYGDIGDQDLMLMRKLSRAGSDHAKFKRMINVYADIKAPLYWWKEMDTYKVGTVRNSCSTMHKIAERQFKWDDFSTEHLGVETKGIDCDGNEVDDYKNLWPEAMRKIIYILNVARHFYLEETDPDTKKEYWWQMIQLLPSSYNQSATLMFNYETLTNIYRSRKNHKLDEWHTFCDWIETLPHARGIITPGGETMDA